MRQLWISTVILAVVAGLLAWNAHTLTTFFQPLSASLSQASDAVGREDWSQAGQLTRQARQRWQEKSPYLHMVQNHGKVEEISLLFCRAEDCLASRNAETYLASVSSLTASIQQLQEAEQLSAENLF